MVKGRGELTLTMTNIVDNLIKIFPALRRSYERDFDDVEKQLLHVIIGQLFKPYVIRVFTNHTDLATEKRNISEFMESMAMSSEKGVICLLTDTLIEELLDYPNVLNAMRPFLGRATLTYLNNIQSSFNHFQEFTN